VEQLRPIKAVQRILRASDRLHRQTPPRDQNSLPSRKTRRVASSRENGKKAPSGRGRGKLTCTAKIQHVREPTTLSAASARKLQVYPELT